MKGLSYRRRRKVAPWTTLTLSSRSAGIGVGPKGARISSTSSGRRTVSLSLFGLMFRRRIR